MIEWVHRIKPRAYTAVLFDFDGTVSVIRQGWQDIMYSYAVEVLLAAPHAEDEEAVWRLVRDFVDELTGKQTIYQMIRLADEVLQRGGQPLDPLAYKHEYLRRLWDRIEHRVADLEAGRADPDDWMVPHTRQLLEALRSRGLTLYLASGTDEQYVKNEAAALGVTAYFDGGIYGALDDYQNFSKAQVIAKLIADNSVAGSELLGFGDGFVEIENVKEVGGTAVGVASDEEKRSGMDGWKRERLLKAGADVIVGDYREQETLLSGLLLERK